GVLFAPRRHARTNVVADVLGHLLEERACRATAAGAAGDLRRKAPELERLQDLLRDEHLFGAIAAGSRCQRDTDRVADAFLEEHGESCSRRDDALGAQTGLREAEM